MAELHLIGTLAHDPDGSARLGQLLDEVQPDVVVVEASRAAFERQETGGDQATAAAVEAITANGAAAATIAFWRRWLAKEHLYFEAFGAAAHARQRTVPLHFIEPLDTTPELAPPEDMDDPAAAYALADPDTLRGIAEHDWRGDYARNYARARVDLEAKACLEFLLPVAQQAAYRTRTRRMANQLEHLLWDSPAPRVAARVAVVCPVTQLYFSEAHLTLYAQLYEATAQRYLADSAGLVRDHPIVLPWSTTGRTVHGRQRDEALTLERKARR